MEAAAHAGPDGGARPAGRAVPVVGVVGGGQLALMLGEAAGAAGCELRVLARPADESVRDARAVVGDATAEHLLPFAAGVDVLTFENEKIAPEVLDALGARHVVMRPSAATLGFSDKASQRERLAPLGFPVPRFAVAATPADVRAAAAAIGYPVVCKSARDGYDGKGVVTVAAEAGVDDALASIPPGPVVVEPFLELERELAVLVVRRPSGELRTYPVVETVQIEGMCREVVAPARVADAVAARAVEVATGIAEAVDAVGVLAVELFVAGGEVLVNELAPRVHNSGHLTIEAARTSQFVNHLRAVLDRPLGDTTLDVPAVMANVVGDTALVDPRDRLAHVVVPEGAFVHLYGKTPRPGRKIGHVTVLAPDGDVVTARRIAWRLALDLGGAPQGAPLDLVESR